jgi:hypothetical protein
MHSIIIKALVYLSPSADIRGGLASDCRLCSVGVFKLHFGVVLWCIYQDRSLKT